MQPISYKNRKYMINSKVANISINIDDYLVVLFDAVELEGESGKIFREKNFEKNDDSLAYIKLYAQEERIVLKIGVMYWHLRCLSGDLKNFHGDYEVEYFGHKGKMTVY